jgi:hypothetical protein
MQKNEKQKSKSQYAKKVKRKLGSGTVDPRWMWWTEGATPRRLAMGGAQ